MIHILPLVSFMPSMFAQFVTLAVLQFPTAWAQPAPERVSYDTARQAWSNNTKIALAEATSVWGGSASGSVAQTYVVAPGVTKTFGPGAENKMWRMHDKFCGLNPARSPNETIMKERLSMLDYNLYV